MIDRTKLLDTMRYVKWLLSQAGFGEQPAALDKIDLNIGRLEMLPITPEGAKEREDILLTLIDDPVISQLYNWTSLREKDK